MEIMRINDINKKKEISRKILEALPEWFGIKEARENYIEESTELKKQKNMRVKQDIHFFK